MFAMDIFVFSKQDAATFKEDAKREENNALVETPGRPAISLFARTILISPSLWLQEKDYVWIMGGRFSDH